MTNTFNRNDGTFAQVDMASLSPGLTSLTKATTADITFTTTAYFDAPAVAQGSSGTWYASGSVTLQSTAAATTRYFARLWDGTTTIAAATFDSAAVGQVTHISLSGMIASPGGNLRMSAADLNGAGGVSKILFNKSGFSQDSIITAVRIG